MEKLPPQPEVASGSVLGIAAYRVTDRRHVDADLVGAPRVEDHADERGARQQALDLEVGARFVGIIGVDRHQHPVASMAPDGGVDRAGQGRRMALHERDVLAVQRAFGDQPLEQTVDLV